MTAWRTLRTTVDIMASSTGTFRTLTHMLRMWDDAELADLLLMRPDLASPPPGGLSDIASRATTRHSVSCVVDELNAFELEVARQASGHPHGFSLHELTAGVTSEAPKALETDVAAAVRRLCALALVWGAESQLRPVRALAAVVAPGPGDTSGASSGAAPSPSPRPPEFPDAPRQPGTLVDKVAAGSAFEFVRRIDVLLEHCAIQPVRLRRDGVVASREIRDVSRLLDVPAALANLHLQIAEAARLLGVEASGGIEWLAPTPQAEEWQELPLAAQWVVLAGAWRDALPASGPRWLKQQVLAAFGEPRDGRVLTTTEVRTWLLWQRPRQATAIDRKTATALQQAGELGVLGLGAVASFAQALDVALLDAQLPKRTDEFVLQADLTAVAQGPLTAAAAAELNAFADIESRGGATVYRFSSASLQRGFDRGWDPDAILTVLGKRSRTPVPQPLDYLVRDLARAGSDRGSTAVGDARRTRTAFEAGHRGAPRAAEPDAAPSRLDRSTALSVVAGLRAAESNPADEQETTVAGPRQVGRSPVDTLREAVESGEAVWFSCVDHRGQASERVVRAESVESGALRARDIGSGEVVQVPMSRITAAHILRRTP
jgi:Helicase conserved C-terminal domain